MNELGVTLLRFVDSGNDQSASSDATLTLHLVLTTA